MAVQRGHEGMSASERLASRRETFPTPTAYEGERGASGKPRSGHQVNLGEWVKGVRRSPALLPTPIAGDADRGAATSEGRPNGLRSAVDFPSPRAGSGGSAGGSDLRDVANGKRPRNWPTPRASEWKGTGPIGSKSHDYRVEKHYLDATVQDRTGESGPLNPDWVEWLMGFPLGWTDLEVDEPVFLEGEPWPAEPDVPRMRRDVPRRAVRLKQLGNAVVPKNAELVGWALRDLLETVEEED